MQTNSSNDGRRAFAYNGEMEVPVSAFNVTVV